MSCQDLFSGMRCDSKNKTNFQLRDFCGVENLENKMSLVLWSITGIILLVFLVKDQSIYFNMARLGFPSDYMYLYIV